MTPSRSAEIGLHQVRLHSHPSCAGRNVKLLKDDLLDQRGRERRNSLSSCSLGLRSETLLLVVERIALRKSPITVVLDPVVLVVPCIGGEVKEAQRRLEGAVVLAPVDLDAVVVEVCKAGCQGRPVVLAAAQGRHDIGEAQGILDEVDADRVRSNLNIQ